MNPINTFLETNEKFIFWTLCVLLAVLQYFFGLQHFYWDAERYWECGREFITDNGFSLFNHTTTRGVLFPLFNFGLIEMLGWLDWHEISVFKCLSAVFSTWGLWYVLPSLYAKGFGKQFGVYHKLILVVLTNVFWFRYFSCPLTDFLCFFLLLFGFDLLWSDKVGVVKMMAVGLICGFVFNTRPIYNLLLGVYPLFYMVVSKDKWLSSSARLLVMVAFAFIINIPQLFLNMKVWNTVSFFQPTEAYFKGQSLYLGQLKWGLYVQKYETNVGDSNCYLTAPVFFFHDKIESPKEVAEINAIQSYAQYIEYLTHHPAKVFWFAKNLFNGLDLHYNTPYIYHLKPNLAFAIFNYLVWFAGITILVLLGKEIRQSKGFNFIGLYLMITCALSVPIAIETRFLIAIHLLCYVILVMNMSRLINWILQLSGKHKLWLTLALVVWVTICVVLSQQTYSELELDIHC